MAEPIVIGDGDGDGRNRRILVLAGAALAVVLAVVVLPGLLFGGGGDDDEDFDFPPVAQGVPTTTVPEDPPAETFESFSDKNPFSPLVDVTPAAGGGGDVGTSVDPTTTTTPFPDQGSFGFPNDGPTPTFPPNDGSDGGSFGGDPGAGNDPGTGGDTSTTSTTGPPPPPARQPDRVSLLEVYTDQGGTIVASVRVNDATHQVAEGDEFATSYRVLDLDIGTRCAQLLFGDDRFGLCEGEETLK